MTPAPGVTRDAAKAAAQQVSSTYYAPDVQTRREYLDSVDAQIDQLLAFVYGLLAVAVIIAVIGIGNTISLSVYERTHELGLLRAVGQSRRRVRTMIRGEAIVVAIFGTVGGLLLGTVVGWAVVRAMDADQGIVRFALPLDRIAVVVALGALAGVLAAHRPARAPPSSTSSQRSPRADARATARRRQRSGAAVPRTSRLRFRVLVGRARVGQRERTADRDDARPAPRSRRR